MKKALILLVAIIAYSTIQAQNTEPASNQDADSIVAKQDTSITDRVVYWYYDHLNYGAITLLMGIESSFIPFPSEVVVPPAAWKACDEESSIYPTRYKWLNIVIVVLFATLGALIGALINYYLSFFLGRPIVYWFADSINVDNVGSNPTAAALLIIT